MHPGTDSKRPDQLVSGVLFFSGREKSANGQAKKTAEEVSYHLNGHSWRISSITQKFELHPKQIVKKSCESTAQQLLM